MTILRANTISGIGQTFGPLLDGDLEFNSQNYVILPKGSSNQQGVLRTTEDVIGVGGTYYDNLVLAMPFNEATGLRDVSSRNRNPGAYGNVSISSTISKYYGSSAKFDGNSIVRVAGIGSDFAFSDKNFTVEGYFRSNNAAATTIPIALTNLTVGGNSDAGWYIRFISNNIEGSSFSGGDNVGVTTYSSASNDTWYHVAYVRNGSTFTLYVDGTSADTTTSSGSLNHNSTWKVDVGHGYGGANYFDGYIQDVRVYQGIAKYTADFTPPERIAETGVGFKTGELRYNTDSNKVELYDGNQWVEVQSSRPDLNGGARGVFAGGQTPTVVSTIDYINISSTGNAISFGNLATARLSAASVADSTRGLIQGGGTPTITNTTRKITISSTGSDSNFGNLITSFYSHFGCANSTRGVFGGSAGPSYTNVLEYVTIQSDGTAADFGDVSTGSYRRGNVASTTRGVLMGNYAPGGDANLNWNIIEFITISTIGNATDFGDLTGTTSDCTSSSNSTRGLRFGAWPSGNVIDYITIATLGNAINFGDLTVATYDSTSTTSPTRAIICGGNPGPALSNTIDYVTISTQGDAVDFGDLTQARRGLNACSNAHGGL